jgi:glycine/D-amino acid oxidase-like deaminating enzyme
MIFNLPLWGSDAPPPFTLPALADDVTADVCVVGLGGSGLACIGELARAGRDVVGLDAHGVAAGAAGRNGGFLLGGLAMFHHDAVQRFGDETASALYAATLEQIDRMAAETPQAVRRTGSLRIATSGEELDDCALQQAAMRRSGFAVEAYDGPEGRGLLFPADAAFDPAARCRALAADALNAGIRLFERSPAVRVEAGMVTTPNGRVRAPHIVIAVDGRLETIVPALADRVRSARLQMLGTGVDRGVSLPRPVYARWGLDYWQQLADGRVVLGGCRDLAEEAEGTTDTAPTDEIQAAMTALLRRIGVTAPVTHRWGATVGFTDSGLPVCAEVQPGVWALGGYSGTGNVVGALCGRAVAETLITGRTSDFAARLNV